jgi:hypothetical protein
MYNCWFSDSLPFPETQKESYLGGPSSALGLPAGLASVCLAGRGSSRLPPTEARILSSDAGFNRKSSENLLVDLFWWCRSKLSESTTVKSECRVRGLWFCASRSRRCSIWSNRAPIARPLGSSSNCYIVNRCHVSNKKGTYIVVFTSSV